MQFLDCDNIRLYGIFYRKSLKSKFLLRIYHIFYNFVWTVECGCFFII